MSFPGYPTRRNVVSRLDKFQITRFLRFASQITRPTIFSCLARFPSNQFTQSPTIRVSGYPVAKICHVRLPGRPNLSSRLPGNDIFPAQRNFIKKCRFQITQHGEMSFPAYPTRRNVVSRLPGRQLFSCQITRSAKFLVQITRRLTFLFEITRKIKFLVSAYPDADGCLDCYSATTNPPRRTPHN